MTRTIINITKNGTENSASVMRRFSRRVRESGIVRKVKGLRYNERTLSHFTLKKNALKKMERAEEWQKLYKLGKVGNGQETRNRRR